jgi:sortase A
VRRARVAGSLALLLGACLTGRDLYLRGKAELACLLIRIAWEETLRTGRNTPPWPWADTHPVGRLLIPRLGFDEIVLEGASLRTLAFGPARMMSGAAPGEPGNLLLAGHRTSWFLPLQHVRRGDAVIVEYRDGRTGALGRSTYQVEDVRVVEPEEAAPLLGPSGDDALTLVTCFPFGYSPWSPQRYVVRARRQA